tara:strand:- start:12112 stop:12411 length:300 start_codon:yes stop_codon:yes gene_type:complete
MSTDDTECFMFIDDFINKLDGLEPESWLLNRVQNKPIFVNDKKYILNVWVEDIAQGKLLIVEVMRKNLFFETSVSKGILFDGEHYKKLTQEEMWDIGIS